MCIVKPLEAQCSNRLELDHDPVAVVETLKMPIMQVPALATC